MTRAQITKWREIDSLLSIFCKASGLVINPLKSSFHFSGLQEGELTCFKALFPYNFVELNEGFWYLGFFLKPTNYRVVDWSWLIEKFEKRMGLWCHRWLSLGERFVLVKAVLESLFVYWLAVAIIPLTVLNRIRQLDVQILVVGHWGKGPLTSLQVGRSHQTESLWWVGI
jgi:hypothetical protein